MICFSLLSEKRKTENKLTKQNCERRVYDFAGELWVEVVNVCGVWLKVDSVETLIKECWLFDSHDNAVGMNFVEKCVVNVPIRFFFVMRRKLMIFLLKSNPCFNPLNIIKENIFCCLYAWNLFTESVYHLWWIIFYKMQKISFLKRVSSELRRDRAMWRSTAWMALIRRLQRSSRLWSKSGTSWWSKILGRGTRLASSRRRSPSCRSKRKFRRLCQGWSSRWCSAFPVSAASGWLDQLWSFQMHLTLGTRW